MQGGRTAGFTIIEIMIVVLIVGVTVVLVAPSISRSTGKARVKRAASILAGDMELAFSTAARQRKPVRVVFNSGTLSYTIQDRATSTVLVSRDFGTTSELPLTSFTASLPTLDIYPNGIASGPDTLSLTLGAHSRKVIVTRIGIIRGLQS
jgi:prepilin-type N-terminal cleavage/methylation domain-containing protein